MKISFIDNGLDSLQKGFAFLLQYEELLNLEPANEEKKYLILKDAVLSIHHGIEILLKAILLNESTYLIFSEIDQNVKKAFAELRTRKFESVFQTSLRSKLHTVTFQEAMLRVTSICGLSLSSSFEQKLSSLQDLRNQIMHSEIYFNELEVSETFRGFIDEMDTFFLKALGKQYRTVTRYSFLVENYDNFLKLLEKKGLHVKKKAVDCFLHIFEDVGLSMGPKEIKVIDDINIVTRIMKQLFEADLNFGTDLYNGYCSGAVVSFKRIADNCFAMFTKDNNAEYIFRFRRLLLYLPSVEDDQSPILLFEADNIDVPLEQAKWIQEGRVQDKYINGIHFVSEEKAVWDYEEICKFYERSEYDEYYTVPEYYTITKFLSQGLFCFINIQGLRYCNYRKLLYEHRDLSLDKFAAMMRKTLG